VAMGFPPCIAPWLVIARKARSTGIAYVRHLASLTVANRL